MQDPKQVAGYYAANLVQDGMIVGLGTGSTARFAIERLGQRVASGLSIKAVPTSEASAKLARKLSIELVSLDNVASIDITIDGADEIDTEFNMIKGGGGALLREKVVASITRKQVCIVDPSKVVEQLGKFALPVEVVPFGLTVVKRRLEALGAAICNVRQDEGIDYITDNHNKIIDCGFYPIERPAELERQIKMIPGVVEVGLFIGLAHVLVIGNPDGSVTVRERL
ncbi:MAG: ribose-5-phosphate isomerase RpiA [Acidobacteriota bacterium]|nr:ribose-5-phosphate isomerase RpiA [Blastocatellia bacterium]MDW8412712.1 ribose-5-phosphate isomerase RpiA [Acidobacteriota bacterium]